MDTSKRAWETQTLRSAKFSLSQYYVSFMLKVPFYKQPVHTNSSLSSSSQPTRISCIHTCISHTAVWAILPPHTEQQVYYSSEVVNYLPIYFLSSGWVQGLQNCDFRALSEETTHLAPTSRIVKCVVETVLNVVFVDKLKRILLHQFLCQGEAHCTGLQALFPGHLLGWAFFPVISSCQILFQVSYQGGPWNTRLSNGFVHTFPIFKSSERCSWVHSTLMLNTWHLCCNKVASLY